MKLEFPGSQAIIEKNLCPISVVVADDHPIVRSGIKAELEAESDIKIVGEAADGDEILQRAHDLQPGVLVLDINMPGMKVLQVIQQLMALPASPRILILTVEEDIECVLSVLKAGAKGYLLKDEDPHMIVEGVRAVADGEIWLSKAILASLVEYTLRNEARKPELSLTPREMDVLQLIARGKYNDQIASTLSITEGTVKNHLTSLYDKLDVHSRAELVAYAWQNGLVSKS
jgi:DNA-binding NarL/FixJ family response regulator